LRVEPVEDYRIDFEDGYGIRPEAEEDGHAQTAAEEVAKAMAQSSLPPSMGIRIKSFGPHSRTRSMRTLELFVTALHRAGGHSLREWIVTLPKVVSPAQVEELALLLSQLERKLGLPHGWMKIEIMIETPQALIGPSGELQVPKLVAAGNGRCKGVHFGPY